MKPDTQLTAVIDAMAAVVVKELADVGVDLTQDAQAALTLDLSAIILRTVQLYLGGFNAGLRWREEHDA